MDGPQGYLSQIVSWRSSPGPEVRAELVEVLGLTYNELFKRIPKARKLQPAPKERKGRRATKARRLVPTDRTYPEMPSRAE